jgi:hypothetical protein
MKLGGASIVETFGPFSTVVGTAANTFTTKRDISPLPIPRIPGGTLYIGDMIKIEAEGEYSCATGVVATPGLHLCTTYADDATTPVVATDIALASAITTGTSPTAWPWRMEWRGKVTKTGTAGTLVGEGDLEFGTSLTAFTGSPIPITLALRTVAINTTIDNRIGVSWTWGASAAGNTVTTYSITCQRLN